jgi:membrane dipeptidase
MGLEGAHALEGSLDTLREFQAAGVRYVTLTHTRSNEFADSAGSWRETDPAKLAALRVHGGLSDRGRELVAEMNRLGMLVDVSHVSDETVVDVLEVARAPVIASHSGARALCDVRRNIPDDLLKAIGAKGGVVMVNFHSAFIDPAVGPAIREWATRQGEQQDALLAQYGRGEQYARALYQVMRFGQQPATSLDLVTDHIEHIARVAGVGAVGIGSDFDGDILPPWELDDVSRFPNLTADLRFHGWDRDQIHKVLGGNTLRVMRAAEAFAAESAAKR